MKSSEAAMGGGEVGAQRPVLRSNELKKTGARSARARTRGQNPLVVIIFDIPESQFIERVAQDTVDPVCAQLHLISTCTLHPTC